MVIAIYFIIALGMGVFMAYCNATRSSDFKEDIRDFQWWLALVVMALIWPVIVFQLLAIIIRRIMNSVGV